MMYLDGKGVEKDYKTAYSLFYRAASVSAAART
jgi:TPR repeat protein